MDVSEEELQPLYDYVDEIPLSRPKRNIARDFADGVLVAEIVHHEAPRVVELHNYSSANSVPQKLYNWETLNLRVFKRHLGFVLAKSELEAVCNCEVGAIERILKLLRIKLGEWKQRQAQEKEEAVQQEKERKESQQTSAGSAESPTVGKPKSTAASATATVTIGRPEISKAKPPSAADVVIKELRDTNELLMLRSEKLEQLVRLKDAKISTLNARLKEAGLV